MYDQYRLLLAHQKSLLLNQGIPMGVYGVGVISISDGSNRCVAVPPAPTFRSKRVHGNAESRSGARVPSVRQAPLNSSMPEIGLRISGVICTAWDRIMGASTSPIYTHSA